jgi:hypothetical protein
MTVSSTSSRVVCLGDGSATSFPFPFKVTQPADLVVVYTDATGSDFTLSPSQYTATGFGLDAGGTVIHPPSGPPISAGTKLTIYRDVAVTQPTAISNQGAMWPQVIEAALDRLTFIAQRVADSVSRSLVISPTDDGVLRQMPNATTRAGSVLAFDAAGQPYAAKLTGSLVSVASWLVDNFFPAGGSATTARDALGAVGRTDTGTVDISGGRLLAPTRSLGDNGTDVATTAFVRKAALWSYLAGLGLSNDGAAPNTRIAVAAGVCSDDGNNQLLRLPTGGTLDCTTVGANGLAAGALANGTWYHVFIIGQAGGATALLASTLASPTLPSPYTLKRRLGSFRTDASAHIVGFVQDGDFFQWSSPTQDFTTTNPGTSAVLQALNVPPGIMAVAHTRFTLQSLDTGASTYLAVSDPATTALAPGAGQADMGNAQNAASAAATISSRLTVRTNGSQQIRIQLSRSSANVSVSAMTVAWIDRRGRDL